MVVFPNCKINLGLQILDKRSDGFHNLETVFYPIPLKDALEITQAKDDKQLQEISFTQSGAPVGGIPEENICIKAYDLLKKDFPQLPPIQMHLHKAIPMGAGLGGGSANGAFALKLLNDKFQLNLLTEQLINYSLQLGSDCPFFIVNQPCYATGRGEVMEQVRLDLSGYQLVLINPGIHVNTGWAFSQLSKNVAVSARKTNLKVKISQPVENWKHELVNDFETPVFSQYPLLKELKELLYQQGAVYSAMSGSGSTLYGIFKNAQPLTFMLPHTYFMKAFLL